MNKRLMLTCLATGVVASLLGPTTLRPQEPPHPKARYSFGSVGIVSGESIIVSAASPHSQYPPVPCRIVLRDESGKIVFDTGVVQLLGGQTQSFAVDWSNLPAVQDQLGRKWVRAVVLLTAPTPQIPPDPCAPSLELVSSDTGQTFAIAALPAVQFTE